MQADTYVYIQTYVPTHIAFHLFQFCSTRKGTIQAANVLVKDTRFIMNAEHSQRLKKIANVIKDAKLRGL